ncbi:MAG: AhpC/TSA family protein [Niastella sp.]|nr:AhpC/TSA family protein [Niastella sp.]
MKTLIACLYCLVFPVILSAQYQVQAHLSGFANGTVFYLKDIETDQVLDSATLQKGAFLIKGSFEDGPRSLWLYTHVKDSFYYCNLLMGNEKVRVEGSVKDMPFFLRITGSPTQDVYNVLNRQTAQLYQSRDSLTSLAMPLMIKNEQQARQDSIWNIVRGIDNNVDSITKKFIKEHINSYAGLRCLYFYRFKLDTATLRDLYGQLRSPFAESRFAKTIQTFLRVGAPVKTGDHLWDFTAIDSTGKSHQLSGYLGKYILLNFSTTYCGPCVLSKGELQEVIAKYSNQLSLLTFNADASRDVWLKGVRRDQPTWPVLWDGKAGHSEAILKYGVQGYPTFFLIDPKGVIVHRWSGYDFHKKGILDLLQKKLPVQNMP